MEHLSCLFNPGPCLTAGVDAIVAIVPWWWVLWSFLAGTVFGAVAGWLGVATAIGTILAFLGGRSTSRRDRGAVGNAKPPPPVPPKPQRKTLRDLFKR